MTHPEPHSEGAGPAAPEADRAPAGDGADRGGWSPLSQRYQEVRDDTEALAAPLGPEDQVVQSMPDVSPTKWHRAHVTWFFETFLLQPGPTGYDEFHPDFCYLFNSYYEAVGPRHPRPQRGLLSRPTCAEVAAYRAHVDDAMAGLLARDDLPAATLGLVELGLHHEQQHQELLLMDILHVLSCNPLHPAYRTDLATASADPAAATRLGWVEHDGGVVEVGHEGPGFAFDNEGPPHEVLLTPFRLADRLVTNGEWLEFQADGGYQRPELWLSDGWATVQAQGWDAPLYWQHDGDGWQQFDLGGLRPVDPLEPVVHVSHYEADAFAHWAGARLPTELEWETVASAHKVDGNLAPAGRLHPAPAPDHDGPRQLFGDVWEWSASPYVGYPGFAPAPGAVGEYNGKFMSGQQVLRGGCCATPGGHVRPTYRNFFPPSARWAFSGLRLAADG